MKADKWLEINLVGLVVLGALAFGASKLMDMSAELTRLQTTVSSASSQVNAIAHEVPDVAAVDQRKFEQSLAAARRRNAATYALTGAESISESLYVPVGGIEQWISIRGESGKNPVILFLHGGPGAATNPWAYPYFRAWEKYFTVVQWDQPGAGRTLGRNGPPAAGLLTVDRVVKDGIELSEYLRGHLHKSRIILVAQSWGSLVGVLMVKARPDLFSAFVGTGQIVDPAQADRIAYRMARQTASARNDAQAAAALKAAGPPPYQAGSPGDKLFDQWRRLCEGDDTGRFLAGRIGLALTAPGYTIHDVDDWRDGRALSAHTLGPQEAALKPQRLAGTFSIPMFVFQGAHDCTAPAQLAQRYIESIKAPTKAYVAIPNAGHFAVFMQSYQFLQQLLMRVRPLAMASD